MKTTIRPTVLAFAFFVCTTLSAQNKVASGYYITQQGDTVKGMFPRYSQWDRNPAEVEFTTATSQKPFLLTPRMCRKFVVTGFDEYLSYTGLRLTNPIDDDEIIVNRNYSSYIDETEKVETFLRLIIRTAGNELYVYKGSKRSNLFILLHNQPLTELRYKKYYDKDQINELADYKQQLNNLFGETIETRKQSAALERLPYAASELTTFLQALFPEEKTRSRQRNPADGWIIAGGVIHNSIQVAEEKYFLSVSRKQQGSFSPLFCIGYYQSLQRNFGRYFIYPQLKLFRFKTVDESSDGVFLYSTNYQVSLAACLEINGGINIINREQFRLFLSGGVGLAAIVNGHKMYQRYVADGHSAYGAPRKSKLAPATYDINTAVGIVLHNKVFLTAAYMVPAQLTYAPENMAMLRGALLGLGYKLW